MSMHWRFGRNWQKNSNTGTTDIIHCVLKTFCSYFKYNFVISELILIISGKRIVWQIGFILVPNCSMFSFTAENQLKCCPSRRQLDANKKMMTSPCLWHSGCHGSWDTAFYWSRTLAPNSADLNPDYKVWGHMQEKMSQTPVRYVDDLKQRLIGTWSGMQYISHWRDLNQCRKWLRACESQRKACWALVLTVSIFSVVWLHFLLNFCLNLTFSIVNVVKFGCLFYQVKGA